MVNEFKGDFSNKNSKLKLLEAFQRLEFAIELMKGKEVNEERLEALTSENLILNQEIELLRKENQELKKIKREVLEDIDFAIKVTEDILGKDENENQS